MKTKQYFNISSILRWYPFPSPWQHVYLLLKSSCLLTAPPFFLCRLHVYQLGSGGPAVRHIHARFSSSHQFKKPTLLISENLRSHSRRKSLTHLSWGVKQTSTGCLLEQSSGQNSKCNKDFTKMSWTGGFCIKDKNGQYTQSDVVPEKDWWSNLKVSSRIYTGGHEWTLKCFNQEI